ncbi:FAD:protein FMN transferase [Clostridium thailandense]|uniref:FAD:protein FMN transferase n=1 Tax=Clostridium thailandense TaxID=2794346 RepID=UPI003989E7F5
MKKLFKRNFPILLVILMFISIFLNGCSLKNTEPAENTEFMLGTICTIQVYDGKKDEALAKAFERVKTIENEMSINKEGTEFDAVANAAGKNFVKVSDDTFAVIKKGLYYSQQSKGAFDITIGPLVKLWGIGTDKAKVPTQSEIDAAKALVGYKDLVLDEANKKVMLKRAGMSIDAGGIGKGFAADEAAKVLKQYGVKHAIINLGGNVLVIGSKPDGKPWGVGIQNPFDTRGKEVGVLGATDKTIVTSGIYERYIEKNGKKYHHILNPFTGYPMDNSLASVTVFTDVSFDADAMTKYIFYLGVEKGPEYVKKSLPGVEAIFITKNKEVYVTEGLKDNFKITNNEFKLINK